MGEGLKRAAAAAMLSNGKGYFRLKPTRYTVRVMAVVEGWVVYRHKGSVPDLETERTFLRDFEPSTKEGYDS